MYVYPLQPFEPGIERSKHLEIVRKVTLFEKMVISHFERQQIANKKIAKLPKGAQCPFPSVLTQILEDFELNPSPEL